MISDPRLPTPQDHHAIIVLGMHRSGTSAMAGILACSGVDFGQHLYPAQDNVNDKGFFEHGPIVDCHDELLLELASSWDDPRPLPAGWTERASVTAYRQRLTTIVRGDFHAAPLWGLKDPRICRLLPLWHAILSDRGVRSHYVIVVRHPLEVAASLARRNGISRDKSLLLWWQHQTQAEAQTRGQPRIFVRYDELLSNPENLLHRLGETFALCWPRGSDEARAEISNFLTPALRHHHDLPFVNRSPIETAVADAYRDFCRAAQDDQSGIDGTLASHAEALSSYIEELNPVLMEHLAAVAEKSRNADLALKRYYGCYAVKIAKRLCLLEQRIASLFGPPA